MYFKLCFIAILFAVVYARPSHLVKEQEDFRGPEENNDELIDTGSEDPAPDPQRYRCPFGWAYRCKPDYATRRWVCKCYRRYYQRDEPAVNKILGTEDTEGI
ncbi:uncharacterized protein LOC144656006 isoform X2 [Oculina patagonica]